MSNPNSLNEPTATERLGPETTQTSQQPIVVKSNPELFVVKDGDGIVQHVEQPVSNPSPLSWDGSEGHKIFYWGAKGGLEYGNVAYLPEHLDSPEGKSWRARAFVAPGKSKVRWFKEKDKAKKWVEQHAYQPVTNPKGCCGGKNPGCCMNPRSAPGKSTRPPAKWWAEMLPRIKAEYPRRSEKSIGRILGGIWHGYDNATQDRLIRKYEGTPSGNPGSNGYVGFYRGKRYEVHSDSSYHAQQEIAKKYGIKKPYEITVVLAEKDGEQVTHTPDFNPKGHRELQVWDKHQLKIARDTLNMPDEMVGVMGGPNKEQAREIIKRLTGKAPKENPDSLSCPGCGQGVGSLGAGTYKCDGCGAQFQVS